jgi:hypothetical protein
LHGSRAALTPTHEREEVVTLLAQYSSVIDSLFAGAHVLAPADSLHLSQHLKVSRQLGEALRPYAPPAAMVSPVKPASSGHGLIFGVPAGLLCSLLFRLLLAADGRDTQQGSGERDPGAEAKLSSEDSNLQPDDQLSLDL